MSGWFRSLSARTRTAIITATVVALAASGIAAAALTSTQTFTYTVPGTTIVIPDRVYSQTVAVPTVTQYVTTTVPATTAWTVAPPTAPITTIQDPVSLGVNINNVVGATYQDYVIDGGGDSSVLLQGTTHGVTLNRFHITRTAANPVVTWAKHGMYVKAYGNTFNDIYMDNTGGHGLSSFSVRMRDNTFNRTILKSYLYVSYYEHDPVAGTVTFNQGDWTFTGDTAVWSDIEGDTGDPATVNQSFLFKDIDAHGPSTFFLKIAAGVYAGSSVTIQNCTLNGQPVTAANIAGVPLTKLHFVN